MALIPLLTIDTVTGTGSQFGLTDATVYGTGGNPARNTMAVFISAYKVHEDEVETALTVASYNKETASTFTVTAYVDEFENISDGWYKFNFVIIPRWLIGTVYNRYDVVWSSAQQAFYQYINVTPSSGIAVTNPAYFTAIADPTTLIDDVGTATASGNLVYQVLETVTTYQTSICFIKAASVHAKETCDTSDCGCDSRTGKLYHKIEELFTNMQINSTTQQYLEGERNARLVERYCSDCGCLER